MKKILWAFVLILIALALVAGGFVAAVGSPQEAWNRIQAMLSGGNGQVAQQGVVASGPNVTGNVQNGATAVNYAEMTPEELDAATTQIRSAGDVTGQVSAAGNIQLASRQFVVMETDGIVQEIAVRVGDEVAAGDLLVALDPAAAETAVERALLNLSSAQVSLEKLYDATDASDVAAAAANLESAKQDLADLYNGPNTLEVAAARSNLAAAWGKYNDLQAGPSAAELTQLSTNMRKFEVALNEARRAYEPVSWRPDVGRTPQAAAYEKATIDYENAKAAYAQATAPASTSDLQSALSQAQNAQKQLDDLLESATPVEIAAAEAKVASDQATLTDLIAGPNANDLESAQIAVDRAFLDLQDAADDLAATRLVAPTDGAVLAVDLTVGQRIGTGTSAVTLARRDNLELEVNVAEVDVSKLDIGQIAQIELDALPGEQFGGEVVSIAPAAESQSGVVNYPVTIRLTTPDSRVRAGMTAVATIVDESVAANPGWLVPATAVSQTDNGAQVMVLRNNLPTPVVVTVGPPQGEWVVVNSAELQTGDRVIGATTTLINEEELQFGPPGRNGGGGGGRPGGG